MVKKRRRGASHGKGTLLPKSCPIAQLLLASPVSLHHATSSSPSLLPPHPVFFISNFSSLSSSSPLLSAYLFSSLSLLISFSFSLLLVFFISPSHTSSLPQSPSTLLSYTPKPLRLSIPPLLSFSVPPPPSSPSLLSFIFQFLLPLPPSPLSFLPSLLLPPPSPS